MNVVTFEVGGNPDDLLHGSAPAPAEDAVRQAWEQAKRQRPVQASDITRVHCVWQPSRVDRVFLAATFRAATCTHDLDRPQDGDWDAAAEPLVAVDPLAAAAEPDGLEWLPTLHTNDGPLQFYASLSLVADRLHLGFARVARTDEGRTRMYHLLRHHVEDMSDEEYAAMVEEAFDNLQRDLRFGISEDAERGTLVVIKRGEYDLCAASAVTLDNFAEQVGAWVGDDELLVAMISPDHVTVAGLGSGWADQLTDWVLTSPDTSGDLVPSLLHVDRSGIREIIVERPSGRVPAPA